jgi:putative endonuclease
VPGADKAPTQPSTRQRQSRHLYPQQVSASRGHPQQNNPASEHPPSFGTVGGGGDVSVSANNDLGRSGEQVAVEYLVRAGLRILDRNWRCAEGEIDIVAAERQVLVVCEVKTRSNTRFGTPLEAITKAKRARLRRLAARWLSAHGVLFDEVRVDVIGLIRDQAGQYQIEHVRGVG